MKGYLSFIFLWCLGVVYAIVETPWNLGTVAVKQHQLERQRRLVAVADTDPLAEPNLLSATLSPDGSYVILSFDRATNKGGFSSNFPCSTYFNFQYVELATCSWQDSQTITIYPNLSPQYVNAAFGMSSVVMMTANAGTVSAACAAVKAVKDCSSLNDQNAFIRAPDTPVTPVVSISTSNSISACMNWFLDLTGSSGDGKRGFTDKSTITVKAQDNSDVSALQTYLQNSLTTQTPMSIDKSLLSVGKTYTVTVRLYNLFDVFGERTTTVTVNSGSTSAPVVQITGANTASLYSSNSLSLSALASVKDCNGVSSSVGLTYQWSVTSGQSIKSNSPRVNQFVVGQNGLTPGQSYTFSVLVTDPSTKLSATSSVSVNVLQSPLIAVISPSTQQLLRAGNSLVLNGQSSSDPDDPTNVVPLVYSWSCATVGAASCALTLSANQGRLTVTADSANVVGSVSTITLTVTKDSRTASTTVRITGIEGSAPLVKIATSVTAVTQINVASPLLLSGLIQTSYAVDCAWSVDSAGTGITEKALTPLTQTIASSTAPASFNFYLPGGVLPVRSSFHFTLSCKTSASSITVTSNGPPLPGSYAVSPSTGTEMSDTFQFSATSWTDPDLPVTYLFGFYSTSGLLLTVQSRSTLTFASSKLPGGSSANQNQVGTTVQVFDGYNASATADFTVTVNPLPASSVASTISSQLTASAQSTNLDDLKSVISVASSVISRVDCTAAPVCANLNRAGCVSTANTCGACLDGFVGQDGDGNSQCVSKNSAGSSTSIQQTCHADCSGHGTCGYVDVNGVTVSSCPITSSSCKPVCTCSNGFFGDFCSFTQEGLASDQSLRSTLLNSLSYIVQSEETTADSVTNVVSSLSGIVQTTSNVNPTSLTTFTSIAQSTLQNSVSDSSITADAVAGLLGPLDVAINAKVADRRRRLAALSSNNGKPSPVDSSEAMEFGHGLLTTFSDIVSRDSAAGVPASTYTFSNFRLSQQTVSTSSSSTPSLEIPLTPIEKAAGRKASKISLDSSSTSNVGASDGQASLLLTQLSSGLLDLDNSKFSDCLSGRFPAGSSITVTLANTAGSTGPPKVKPQNFTSTCQANDYSVNKYTCPESGKVLSHKCSGTAGKITSYCPVLSTVCSNVNLGDASSTYSCTMQSITTETITCKCIFQASSESGRRRLDTTGIMNMVAITEFIGNEMEQTFSAAPALTDPANIEKSLIVIIMYCVLWLSGLFMLGGCIYRQRKMKQIRMEQRLEKMQLAGRESQSSSVDEVREKLIGYVQAIFPVIFYSEHWLVKLKDEIRRNHSYLMLFNSVDGDLADSKRILNGLKLLTSQTALMFLLALLYDLQGPSDNGTCVYHTTEALCTEQVSLLDDSMTYCVWDPVANPTQPCQFNDAGISFKSSLYIQVIVSVFTALLMRPLSLCFDVLLAPAVDHVKEKMEEEKRLKKAGAGESAEREQEEPARVKRSAFQSLFTVEETDPEMKELSNVLVTLMPDDVEMVSRQAKSYFNRINDTDQIEHKALLTSNTGESKSSGRRSMIDKMRSTIALVKNKVLHRSDAEKAEIMFQELKEKIAAERALLSGDELAEFDQQWGLDKDGEFLRNVEHIKGKLDVFEIIEKEVQKVEAETHHDIDRLKLAVDHHTGIEILHKFILDILGRETPAGYIFAGKTSEDFRHSSVYSFRAKVLVSIFIMCANMLFVYYSVLRGYVQGVDWQKQYVIACVIQMILEIYLFETFECIWINVLIPSIVASEVQRVNRLLLGIIDDICDKAASGQRISLTDSRHVLDSTQYLFMSTRLANAFPTLMESMIVRTYHTHLPGELSYKWLASDHSFAAYYRRWVGPTRSSDTSMLIASIGAILATLQVVAFIPFDIQKMVVRFFQPFLFGGLVLLWQDIVASTVGIIIAAVVIFVIVMAIMWHYNKHKETVEKNIEMKIAPGVDTLAIKKSMDGEHIASHHIAKVKSVRVNGKDSSFNTNDVTDNHSVESYGVESVREASAVDDDDDLGYLHTPSKRSKARKQYKAVSTAKTPEPAPVVAASEPVQANVDLDLQDLLNEFGAGEDDEGSYKLSLSDHDSDDHKYDA